MSTLDSHGQTHMACPTAVIPNVHDVALRRRSRVGALVAALMLVVAAVVGCAASGEDAAAPAVTTGKYDQTWAKTYAATTCSEWKSEMTDREQWVAAADMLTGARNKGDSGTGLPSDALVDDFQADITESCSPAAAKAMKIAEVAASVYLIGRDTYAP